MATKLPKNKADVAVEEMEADPEVTTLLPPISSSAQSCSSNPHTPNTSFSSQ